MSRRHVLTLDVPRRYARKCPPTIEPQDQALTGDYSWHVNVVIDPDCDLLGRVENGYGGSYIVLREWNSQVLLHELLHVILGGLLPISEHDPHHHEIITQIEVGLMPHLALLAAGVEPADLEATP